MHLANLRFPFKLQNALVAGDVGGDLDFLAFDTCLLSTTREGSILVTRLIKWVQYEKVVLICSLPHSQRAVALLGWVHHLPRYIVPRAWGGNEVDVAFRSSSARLDGKGAYIRHFSVHRGKQICFLNLFK